MGKKYVVEKPITVRSAALILTDEQLHRRAGLVKPATDEDGNERDGVWSPSNDGGLGVQFKVGELVEFDEEAEKVLIATGQLREVSDSEADNYLHEQEEKRAKATSQSEFQRRPVGDRASSPNSSKSAQTSNTSGISDISDEDLELVGLTRKQYKKLSADRKDEVQKELEAAKSVQ